MSWRWLRVWGINVLCLLASCGPVGQVLVDCAGRDQASTQQVVRVAGADGQDMIRLAKDEGHDLPGCYRCGLDTADFDRDGRRDVVMGGAFDRAFVPGMGNYTYQNAVRLYRNVSCPGGEIRFEFQQELPGVSGGGGALVKVGDYNGDNVPDFAVQFREGETPFSDTSSFMNNGNWSFTRRAVAVGFDTNSTSLGMAAADIDQNGLDDLVFISDGYGAGPGLWYRWHSQSSGWQAQQGDFPHRMSYGGTITAGDLDGDGYPEIAVGGNSSLPFGAYDCTSTVLYGQIHRNKGAGADPKGIEPQALVSLGRFALKADPEHPPVCSGMDNAGMLITDVDLDGNNDLIIAGSADAFNGPVGLNGSQYDFVVLNNTDGSGQHFVAFEYAGEQFPGGTTNGGAGSVDFPNIAVGDLTGDGYPEVFIQGHHRDYGGNVGSYVFDSRLFLNRGGASFTEIDIDLPDVGEGGQAMADFNNDGQIDLLFTGASIPFHSNGNNPTDFNNIATLFTHIYRNTRAR
ncbi:MAG: VCBS repeat-containing protein [Deinococcus sp.]|nr:VCBS repeat-containing protein [Deinococcus sp.]